jgi:hypothetical protein
MKLPWRHVNQALGGFIVARFHFQSSNLRLLVAEFQLLNQTNRDPFIYITILTHESIKELSLTYQSFENKNERK